jgi:hypothetical protein
MCARPVSWLTDRPPSGSFPNARPRFGINLTFSGCLPEASPFTVAGAARDFSPASLDERLVDKDRTETRTLRARPRVCQETRRPDSMRSARDAPLRRARFRASRRARLRRVRRRWPPRRAWNAASRRRGLERLVQKNHVGGSDHGGAPAPPAGVGLGTALGSSVWLRGGRPTAAQRADATARLPAHDAGAPPTRRSPRSSRRRQVGLLRNVSQRGRRADSSSVQRFRPSIIDGPLVRARSTPAINRSSVVFPAPLAPEQRA